MFSRNCEDKSGQFPDVAQQVLAAAQGELGRVARGAVGFGHACRHTCALCVLKWISRAVEGKPQRQAWITRHLGDAAGCMDGASFLMRIAVAEWGGYAVWNISHYCSWLAGSSGDFPVHSRLLAISD